MISDFLRVNMTNVGQRLRLVFLFLWLGFTIVLAFKLRLPDIDWQLALKGWSPIDWVAHVSFPERYALDFKNGMELYDKSASMHIYLLVNRWLGVPVERTIPVVIFAEMIFLAGACIFFSCSLSDDSPLVGGFLFALLVVMSPARDMDLSNFGAPFFWGLYYNFADGFRLIGLAFFLRRKPLIGGLLLGVGFSIHPIMAILGCVFVVGFVAVERNWVKFKTLTLGILAFLVISGAWFGYTYDYSSVVATKVDPLVWIRMVRAFSYHLFPLDYGLLTLDFHKRLLPLSVMCLLALHYLPIVVRDRGRRRGIIGGSAILISVIAIGMWISIYLPIPILIKMALPRASSLLIMVAMAICCIGLDRDINNGNLFQRILSLLIIVSPFIYPPGFPLVPVSLLIIAGHTSKHHAEGQYQSVKIAMFALIVVAVLGNWFGGFVRIDNLPSYTGLFASFDYWNLIAASCCVLAFIWYLSINEDNLTAKSGMKTSVSSVGQLYVFSVVCVLGLFWQKSLVPLPEYRAFGQAYLDTQLWAKTHTPERSLFLVDPTISYGWRDFSERSSFGSLREWLHTSWLYDSNEERYISGLQHFAEFGIELDPYLDISVTHLHGSNNLTNDIRNKFYNLNSEWFFQIREKYNVTHVLMKKDQLLQDYEFKKVYENQHFIVFAL